MWNSFRQPSNYVYDIRVCAESLGDLASNSLDVNIVRVINKPKDDPTNNDITIKRRRNNIPLPPLWICKETKELVRIPLTFSMLVDATHN